MIYRLAPHPSIQPEENFGVGSNNPARILHNHKEISFHNAPNRRDNMMMNVRGRYIGLASDALSPVFIGMQ